MGEFSGGIIWFWAPGRAIARKMVVESASDPGNLSPLGHGEPAVAQAPLASANGSGLWEAEKSRASRSSSSRSGHGWGRDYRVWAVCGFLLLAVGLVFGQTVNFDFLWYDDDGFVFQNPHIAPGLTLEGLRYAFTDGPYGEWTPTTSLSHMLDCQLFGLRPGWHHLTNVLIHGASAVLLFWVLLRMTSQRAVPGTDQRLVAAQVSGGRVALAGPSATSLWPSAWVAAIFAIHPLHVSTVAWISERRELLAGLFFMLALLAYVRYVERPSLARYLPIAACLALGLMAKAILVTVPFVLLLLDFWPLDRFSRRAGTIRLVAGSFAHGLAIDRGKDSAAGHIGGTLPDGLCNPRVAPVQRDRAGRATVARGARGQCPVRLRSLLGPDFLSRQSLSPLSSSGQPPDDRIGDRTVGFAGGDQSGRGAVLAPATVSPRGLAVVFGDARPGARASGDFPSSPGR